MCRVLNAAHRHATAAANPRSIFTLVPLAFAFLDLVRKIKLRVDAGEEVEIGCRKLLEFIGNMVETLKQWAPAAALRLHLQCALVADAVGEEGWTYDVVAQTFEVREDHLDPQARCPHAPNAPTSQARCPHAPNPSVPPPTQVYEEHLADSRAQLAAVTLAAGTLPQAGRPDRALAAPARSPHPRVKPCLPPTPWRSPRCR